MPFSDFEARLRRDEDLVRILAERIAGLAVRAARLRERLAAIYIGEGNNDGIRGRVLGCNGQPWPAGTLEIRDHGTGTLWQTLTWGTNGVFSGSLSLPGSPPWTVDLVAITTGPSASRFAHTTVSGVVLVAGDNDVGDITLTVATGFTCRAGGGVDGPHTPSAPCTSTQLCVTVVSASGCHLQGVPISAPDGFGSTLSGTTDTSGTSCITIPYDGPYTVTVNVPGVGPVSQTVNMTCGGTTNITITMPAGTEYGTLSVGYVTLCDSTGSHQLAPSVSISGGIGTLTGGGTSCSDAFGNPSVAFCYTLPAGTYTVTVSGGGVTFPSNAVTISSCTTSFIPGKTAISAIRIDVGNVGSPQFLGWTTCPPVFTAYKNDGGTTTSLGSLTLSIPIPTPPACGSGGGFITFSPINMSGSSLNITISGTNNHNIALPGLNLAWKCYDPATGLGSYGFDFFYNPSNSCGC